MPFLYHFYLVISLLPSFVCYPYIPIHFGFLFSANYLYSFSIQLISFYVYMCIVFDPVQFEVLGLSTSKIFISGFPDMITDYCRYYLCERSSYFSFCYSGHPYPYHCHLCVLYVHPKPFEHLF